MVRAVSGQTRADFGRWLLVGLGAGGVAGVVAALLSLPLRSPDDVFFNSATVALGALAVGVAGGLHLWWWGAGRRGVATLWLALAALAVAVFVGGLALDAWPNAPLTGLTRFAAPLALVVSLLVGVVAPLLGRAALPTAATSVAGVVGMIGALAVGFALAGRGDAPGGALALPELPPAPALAASLPATPTATVAQAAAAPSAAGSAPTPAGSPASAPAPSVAPTATAGPASPTATVRPNDGLLRPADVAGLTFAVVAGESAATYTVREKLARLPLPNDAVGRTNAVTGAIVLDGRPSTVTVDLRTLQSDQPQRDRFVRQNGPRLDQFPFAEFTFTALDLPNEYRPGETVTRRVAGKLRIREVERDVTITVEARLRDGTLQALAKTAFTWADFGIPPPNIAGIVQVEDTVNVEVLVIARR